MVGCKNRTWEQGGWAWIWEQDDKNMIIRTGQRNTAWEESVKQRENNPGCIFEPWEASTAEVRGNGIGGFWKVQGLHPDISLENHLRLKVEGMSLLITTPCGMRHTLLIWFLSLNSTDLLSLFSCQFSPAQTSKLIFLSIPVVWNPIFMLFNV